MKEENAENIDVADCYEKYAPMVFRRCAAMLRNEDDALDAAQDVFVSLLRRKEKMHGQFLSSLLYTMATNACLNRIRQRRRQGIVSQDPEILCSAAHDPEFERIEAGMLMEMIMESESETNRAMCFMYHGDGMTLAEIGRIAGLSVSGVRKRLVAFGARAQRKLKKGAYGND